MAGKGRPVNWVLWLWLASSPNVLVPLAQYDSKAECLNARHADVMANVRAGQGVGATYFCGGRE